MTLAAIGATQSWSTCSDGDDHASRNGEAVNEMTLRVTSADGTRIAYDRKGTGPAVILVGGTLDDGAENAPLARLLSDHFTVYNYARRGPGARAGDRCTPVCFECARGYAECREMCCGSPVRRASMVG